MLSHSVELRLPYLKDLETSYLSKAEQMHQSESHLTQAKQELKTRLASVNSNNDAIRKKIDELNTKMAAISGSGGKA